MNIIEMHDWFDQIQDKVDSVYYTSVEKDRFINRAIQRFINDIINQFILDPAGQFIISSSLEETLNVSQVLKPLRLIDMEVTSDADGLISNEDINTAIEIRSGETETYLHVLALATTENKSVGFVRENDFYKFEDNEFKKSSSASPVWRLGSEGIYIYPKESRTFKISVIKAPKQVDYDALDSTDLPETTHDYILASALESAGLASRDQALLMMKENL